MMLPSLGERGSCFLIFVVNLRGESSLCPFFWEPILLEFLFTMGLWLTIKFIYDYNKT